MALSKLNQVIPKDLDLFRLALLTVMIAGLILAAWHISWLHNHHRYEMQTAQYGLVFILDKETGSVYFARQGQITEGWTDVWRKAPKLPQN